MINAIDPSASKGLGRARRSADGRLVSRFWNIGHRAPKGVLALKTLGCRPIWARLRKKGGLGPLVTNSFESKNEICARFPKC